MNRRTKWGRVGIAALLLMAAGGVRAQIGIDGSPGGGPFGGNTLGQFPGGRGGGSQFGQFPGGGPGGRQGGVFGMGGTQILASNATVRLAAFCTDLLAEPPNAGTRFAGGGGNTLVALADGRRMTLSQALASNTLALRGRNDSFDPVRRDGSLALDLYLTNNSGQPVRITVAAGASVTPNGQGAQPLPAGSEALFAAAAARGLAASNTMQYAIWAARGSTAEEVEQANMIKLPTMETARVQSLLNQSGIRQEFDRSRGVYAAKYAEKVEKLGANAAAISGTTSVPIGGRATVEGVRTADGRGFVTVKVLQSRAKFYYGAEFTEGKNGRTKVKLTHLVTGKPVRANGAGFDLLADATAPVARDEGFIGRCGGVFVCGLGLGGSDVLLSGFDRRDP